VSIIKAIFFDVAHTLLEKPTVMPTMHTVLEKHGVTVPIHELRARHAILMEAVEFPDRTDHVFYRKFNAAVVRALGAIPTSELLDDLFAAATYQPWIPYQDVATLERIALPKGILSNWDESLEEKISGSLDFDFRWILGSAAQRFRKPDPAFFHLIMEATGLQASEIAYVGDSMKLDIEPATRLGFRAILIDRESLFPYSPLPRIGSLTELESML
jgi:HAD superfamily hydrolase (TIGR01549 family)